MVKTWGRLFAEHLKKGSERILHGAEAGQPRQARTASGREGGGVLEVTALPGAIHPGAQAHKNRLTVGR